MKRRIHIGQPPSVCGRASPTSAWHPEAGTCKFCTGEWAEVVSAPHSRGAPEDPWAAAILAYRLERGLKQAVLAAELGIARPTLAGMEKRTSKKQRMLLRLGRLLAEVAEPQTPEAGEDR